MKQNANQVQHERRYDIFIRVIVELSRLNCEHRKKLARAANVAYSSYGHWLSGHVTHPRIDTLVKTAHVLGYNVELVKRKVKPTLRRVK